MRGFAAKESQAAHVGNQPIDAQGENAGGIRMFGKQGTGGAVDGDVGLLRREHDGDEQLKIRGVFELGARLWIGGL